MFVEKKRQMLERYKKKKTTKRLHKSIHLSIEFGVKIRTQNFDIYKNTSIEGIFWEKQQGIGLITKVW